MSVSFDISENSIVCIMIMLSITIVLTAIINRKKKQ